MPSVSLGKNSILVHSHYNDREICKGIPGRQWNARLRAWEYPRSPVALRNIVKAFGPERVLLSEEARCLLDVSCSGPIPITKTKPWAHQERAFWFAHGLPGAMLAMDMGSGKSKCAIDIIQNRGHKRILILCPASVVAVWPDQIETHAAIPMRVFALRDGSVTKRTKLAEREFGLNHTEPLIVVINYEAAFREPFASWSLKAGFDLLVLDESHKIKMPGGKQSIYCRNLGKRIPYRLGLTGTPLPHSPLDAYAQYRAIDPAVYGTSFAAFRSRYALMGGYQNHQVIGYQNLDELHEKFYSIAFRVEAKDVLDLPEYTHTYRTTRMSAEATRIYDDLESEFVAEVQAGTVTVRNALTKLLRLQQITSGHIRLDDAENVTVVDSAKCDLLTDTFDDLAVDEPVIVFCRFRHDLACVHQAAEQTGRKCLELSGGANELADWQAGEAQVLAVQIQSGGLGIDLTRARYCIFFSLGFSLGEYEQALARCHRPGQTRHVHYVHLLCERTVDEKVYHALRARKQVIESILEEADK